MAHDTHEVPGKVAKGKLREKRFTAEPSGRANFQALIAGLGVAALGAGTYATWVKDVPMPAAPYLFAAGALGVIIASVLGTSDGFPLRVGDAGIAIEQGSAQPERLAWYEIEKVSLEDGDRVVVEGAGKRIVAVAAHHAAATAWILKEALDRIPKRVTIEPDRSSPLMRAADDHVAEIAIEPLQLAGRRCKASNAIISFERDARPCQRCGEVYDKKHVPAKCLTCDASMT
ncbi:MAG TPA: hypothetical protein VJT73_17190 [Polyangiaceae bacterium]|nr:hypothetical protein [Polyangiaceae bacterium]